MTDLLRLIFLTLLPFLELRASIPYGIFATDFSLLTIFLVCVITNILLAPVIYLFLDKLIHIFLKIKVLNRIYQKTITKVQHKVKKYVDRYGILGLAIFIGIPLPGSGVYSGALGAYILGFKFRDFFKAAVLGVVIAGIIVMLISVMGNETFSFLIKRV